MAVVSFFYVESYYLRYFSKPMALELPIFIILYILSKPGGCIDTRYNIYFLSLVVAIFQNQVAHFIYLFYVVFVRGFGGTWVCGESWLAIKDSLIHRPSSQGWAPECPLGLILYVYFVLLPRMVSGSGLPFFLPYMS